MCDLRYTLMNEIKKLDQEQQDHLMMEVLALLSLDDQCQQFCS
jgi:hypothetical protein